MSEIIETYWNVNVAQLKCMLTSKSEIIETYWNVNFFPDYVCMTTSGNNRNILECKFYMPCSDVFCSHEIIETYWNVNEGMEEYIKSVAKGNNRNILQCKSA